MDAPASVHVLTLNVGGVPWKVGPFAQRAAEFTRRIEASDLDVVNFQEVYTRSQLATVLAGLPSFRHVVWRRGITGGPAGGLVTLARQPLHRPRYRSFWRAAPPPAGGLRFRARRTVNCVLQGMLMTELPGLGVRLVNTHLTANRDGDWSAANRHYPLQRRQLRVLHDRLGRPEASLRIVTGDFNLASDGALYPEIVAGGWRDVFADTEPSTFQTEFLPAGAPAHRIDYVLLSGDPSRFPVLGCAPWFTDPVTLDGDRRLYLSDHVALTARIKL